MNFLCLLKIISSGEHIDKSRVPRKLIKPKSREAKETPEWGDCECRIAPEEFNFKQKQKLKFFSPASTSQLKAAPFLLM